MTKHDEISKEQIRRACSAAQKWGCAISASQARAIIEAALSTDLRIEQK